MDIQKRVAEIWASDYIEKLPSFIKERNYVYTENVKSDILIVGFNPSFREGDTLQAFKSNIWNVSKHDNYWGTVTRMLSDDKMDLKEKADYLDIFYFREQDQSSFKKQILISPEGVKFAVDQLNLTMHIIEDIVQPKLIVVKNKEASVYFGKQYDEKGWAWMGYKFEHVQDMDCGELCKITGLIDSEERIAPEIAHTNIMGSYVLFSNHINQYTSVGKRPTPEILSSILDMYDRK